MKKRKDRIDRFKLIKKTSDGFLIAPLTEISSPGHNINDIYRDDHFSLMFAFAGDYHFRIDFQDVILKAPFILCIEPDQVHQLVSLNKEKGWVMGIEAFILEPEFEDFLLTKLSKPVLLEGFSELSTRIQQILQLAFQVQSSPDNPFYSKSVVYLINLIFCLLIAEIEKKRITQDSKEKRGYIIGQTFRLLKKKHFKQWKSPSRYASQLSISTSHLNDTVKDLIGLSVSTHIKQHNILKAKRLLYFTDLEVREVAFKLGYDDAVYFGRLFKKATGMACLDFRKNFRFDSLKPVIDDHYPSIPWQKDDEFAPDFRSQPAQWDEYWLCDAMDGAVQYMQHVPGWTINLVLIRYGQPFFSIIYDPLSDEMFWAKQGEGSFMNGQRISIGKGRSTGYACCF